MDLLRAICIFTTTGGIVTGLSVFSQTQVGLLRGYTTFSQPQVGLLRYFSHPTLGFKGNVLYFHMYVTIPDIGTIIVTIQLNLGIRDTQGTVQNYLEF